MESQDGIVWNKILFNSTVDLYSMAKGKDKYVAVGDKGNIFYSNDLQKWDRYKEGNTSNVFESVYWDGNSFFAVGLYATCPVIGSQLNFV